MRLSCGVLQVVGPLVAAPPAPGAHQDTNNDQHNPLFWVFFGIVVVLIIAGFVQYARRR